MARTRYPDLPPKVMRPVWVRRVVFTVTGGAAIVVPLLNQETVSSRIVGLLILAGTAFIASAWVHPMSPSVFAFLALSMGLMLFVTPSLTLKLLAMMPIGMLVWAGRIKQGSLVDRDSLRLIELDGVMPHAMGTRDEFVRLGFQQVGAAAAVANRHEIVIAYMISPDRRSFAAFTDLTAEVTSVFRGDRVLATTTSSMAATPLWTLTNPEVSGTPEVLVASHERALDLVSERGAVPITLDPLEVPTIALNAELQQVVWLDANPGLPTPLHAQERLWTRLGRYQEVEDWLAAPGPPSGLDQSLPRADDGPQTDT